MLESLPRQFDSFDAKQEYFGAILDERHNGGLESLMHVLLNQDTSDFCPTRRPAGAMDAMVQQKLLAMGTVEAFVHDLLCCPEDRWPTHQVRETLYKSFLSFASTSGHGRNKMSNKIFTMQLRLHAPAGYFIKVLKFYKDGREQGAPSSSRNQGRCNVYEMPPQIMWRRFFEGVCACM